MKRVSGIWPLEKITWSSFVVLAFVVLAVVGCNKTDSGGKDAGEGRNDEFRL